MWVSWAGYWYKPSPAWIVCGYALAHTQLKVNLSCEAWAWSQIWIWAQARAQLVLCTYNIFYYKMNDYYRFPGALNMFLLTVNTFLPLWRKNRMLGWTQNLNARKQFKGEFFQDKLESSVEVNKLKNLVSSKFQLPRHERMGTIKWGLGLAIVDHNAHTTKTMS